MPNELETRVSELELEVKKLRCYVAESAADCIYCGLSKARMSECQSGFPGCGRMDDILEGEWLRSEVEQMELRARSGEDKP